MNVCGRVMERKGVRNELQGWQRDEKGCISVGKELDDLGVGVEWVGVVAVFFFFDSSKGDWTTVLGWVHRVVRAQWCLSLQGNTPRFS